MTKKSSANKTAKKSTKKVNPVYTVDLTNVKNANDIYFAFVTAKVRAGEPITTKELNGYTASYRANVLEPTKQQAETFIVLGCSILSKMLNDMYEECETKNTPWYKKAWNKVKSFFHGK